MEHKNPTNIDTGNIVFARFLRMGKYSIIPIIIFLAFAGILFNQEKNQLIENRAEIKKEQHWFLLHRKSEVEYLYKGLAGDISKSKLIKKFVVNTGIPNKKPTPLPSLLGREYFLITKKLDTKEYPETAPYFLEFDIVVPSVPPYGPQPYLECNGIQCDWEIAGPFGLHGINGDESRLTDEGSSGCVRHSDSDITYLYNLLNPDKEEIRYYIKDV